MALGVAVPQALGGAIMTPRGDGDGLWIAVVMWNTIASFLVVLVTSFAFGWLRHLASPAAREAPSGSADE